VAPQAARFRSFTTKNSTLESSCAESASINGRSLSQHRKRKHMYSGTSSKAVSTQPEPSGRVSRGLLFFGTAFTIAIKASRRFWTGLAAREDARANRQRLEKCLIRKTKKTSVLNVPRGAYPVMSLTVSNRFRATRGGRSTHHVVQP